MERAPEAEDPGEVVLVAARCIAEVVRQVEVPHTDTVFGGKSTMRHSAPIMCTQPSATV